MGTHRRGVCNPYDLPPDPVPGGGALLRWSLCVVAAAGGSLAAGAVTAGPLAAAEDGWGPTIDDYTSSGGSFSFTGPGLFDGTAADGSYRGADPTGSAFLDPGVTHEVSGGARFDLRQELATVTGDVAGPSGVDVGGLPAHLVPENAVVAAVPEVVDPVVAAVPEVVDPVVAAVPEVVADPAVADPEAAAVPEVAVDPAVVADSSVGVAAAPQEGTTDDGVETGAVPPAGDPVTSDPIVVEHTAVDHTPAEQGTDASSGDSFSLTGPGLLDGTAADGSYRGEDPTASAFLDPGVTHAVSDTARFDLPSEIVTAAGEAAGPPGVVAGGSPTYPLTVDEGVTVDRDGTRSAEVTVSPPDVPDVVPTDDAIGPGVAAVPEQRAAVPEQDTAEAMWNGGTLLAASAHQEPNAPDRRSSYDVTAADEGERTVLDPYARLLSMRFPGRFSMDDLFETEEGQKLYAALSTASAEVGSEDDWFAFVGEVAGHLRRLSLATQPVTAERATEMWGMRPVDGPDLTASEIAANAQHNDLGRRGIDANFRPEHPAAGLRSWETTCVVLLCDGVPEVLDGSIAMGTQASVILPPVTDQMVRADRICDLHTHPFCEHHTSAGLSDADLQAHRGYLKRLRERGFTGEYDLASVSLLEGATVMASSEAYVAAATGAAHDAVRIRLLEQDWPLPHRVYLPGGEVPTSGLSPVVEVVPEEEESAFWDRMAARYETSLEDLERIRHRDGARLTDFDARLAGGGGTAPSAPSHPGDALHTDPEPAGGPSPGSVANAPGDGYRGNVDRVEGGQVWPIHEDLEVLYQGEWPATSMRRPDDFAVLALLATPEGQKLWNDLSTASAEVGSDEQWSCFINDCALALRNFALSTEPVGRELAAEIFGRRPVQGDQVDRLLAEIHNQELEAGLDQHFTPQNSNAGLCAPEVSCTVVLDGGVARVLPESIGLGTLYQVQRAGIRSETVCADAVCFLHTHPTLPRQTTTGLSEGDIASHTTEVDLLRRQGFEGDVSTVSVSVLEGVTTEVRTPAGSDNLLFRVHPRPWPAPDMVYLPGPEGGPEVPVPTVSISPDVEVVPPEDGFLAWAKLAELDQKGASTVSRIFDLWQQQLAEFDARLGHTPTRSAAPSDVPGQPDASGSADSLPRGRSTVSAAPGPGDLQGAVGGAEEDGARPDSGAGGGVVVSGGGETVVPELGPIGVVEPLGGYPLDPPGGPEATLPPQRPDPVDPRDQVLRSPGSQPTAALDRETFPQGSDPDDQLVTPVPPFPNPESSGGVDGPGSRVPAGGSSDGSAAAAAVGPDRPPGWDAAAAWQEFVNGPTTTVQQDDGNSLAYFLDGSRGVYDPDGNLVEPVSGEVPPRILPPLDPAVGLGVAAVAAALPSVVAGLAGGAAGTAGTMVPGVAALMPLVQVPGSPGSGFVPADSGLTDLVGAAAAGTAARPPVDLGYPVCSPALQSMCIEPNSWDPTNPNATGRLRSGAVVPGHPQYQQLRQRGLVGDPGVVGHPLYGTVNGDPSVPGHPLYGQIYGEALVGDGTPQGDARAGLTNLASGVTIRQAVGEASRDLQRRIEERGPVNTFLDGAVRIFGR
jgi:hypothetical protein